MSSAALWITLIILMGIGGFWLYGLGWIIMRPDEQLVYQHTVGSLMDTVWYQGRQDVQAPLWHAFFWTWRQIAGDSEFAGRYQGVLFSLLTIAFVYQLAGRWFDGQHYGWFAMIAVAVNAHFFTYAFEIRPYPVVLLAAVLSMWFLERWLRLQTRRAAIIYGATLALLMYVHYFLAFLGMAQLIYIVAQRPKRAIWMQYGTALLTAFGFWAVWMPIFVGQVITLREIEGSLGIATTTTATNWKTIWRLLELTTNGLPYLLIAMAVWGGYWVRKREYGLVLLWAFGVPAISFTVNLVANVYDPRYVVAMSLGVGIMAGVVIASTPYWLVRIGLLAAFVGVSVWQIPDHLPDRVPHREIFQTISRLSEPGDVMYFDLVDERSPLTAWQMNQYLAPELESNRVRNPAEAEAHRRIWHVTADLHDSGVRERFWEIERTHPLQMALGDCRRWCFYAQLLEGAPNAEALHTFTAPRFDDRLSFYGADHEITDDGIAVRLWWMVEQPLVLDYSMSVRLVDANGGVVMQEDSPPLNAEGEPIPTSQLEAQRMTIDWRNFRQLAAGDYHLQLVVYQPIDGYTLPTETGEDRVQLQMITVP